MLPILNTDNPIRQDVVAARQAGAPDLRALIGFDALATERVLATAVSEIARNMLFSMAAGGRVEFSVGAGRGAADLYDPHLRPGARGSAIWNSHPERRILIQDRHGAGHCWCAAV